MRIVQGALRVAFFLLIGKFAGAVKEMAIANRYGVSDVVDAYQFTMTMASWLPMTIVGAFSIVLIPVMVKLRHLGEAEKKQFIAELQAWVLTLGLGIAVVTWLFWPQIIQLTAGQLNASAREFSQLLIWAFAPGALLILLIGVSTSRLRARERHINTLLDSLPALFILLWIFLSPDDVSVWPLLLGTLVGYFVQSMILWYLAERADGHGFILPRWQLNSSQWHLLLSSAGIMLIGQIAMSFVGPLDQMVAAQIGENANATMGYATRLLSLILGLGAASVGRAALPVLADVHNRGDAEQAKQMALKWSLAMLVLGSLAVLIMWFLAPYMVKILFEHGAFTAENTLRVSEVLRYGLVQLPFYFGVLILVQLLASQHRYRIMASIAVANFLIKALMNYLLAPSYGVNGIMLATGAMYLLSFVCYFLVAWRLPKS